MSARDRNFCEPWRECHDGSDLAEHGSLATLPRPHGLGPLKTMRESFARLSFLAILVARNFQKASGPGAFHASAYVSAQA